MAAKVTSDYPLSFGAESAALLELMRQGAVERDAERIINLICEQAAKLTKADYAGVRLVDDAGHVEWRGMYGNRSDAWRRPERSRLRGLVSEAMTAGQTIVSRTSELTEKGWIFHANSVRSSEGGVVQVLTPLAYSGRMVGTLVLGWRSDITPSEEQIRMAETLAGYGAVVLDNARSREESERRRAEAEALAELARRGAAEQRMDDVVELVCRSACQLIGADYSALLLRVPTGGVTWLGVWGNRSNIWKERHNPSGRGPAAISMAEARTVVFRGEGEADGTLENLVVLNSEDTETALAVPLLRRDGPFGSLVAGWRRPQEVTPKQRQLAEALGGYAAAVLDNALSHAESERRRVEAEALAELVRIGASERDPDRVMPLICEHGCRLLGADYASVAIADQDERRVWHGVSGLEPTRRSPSRGRGIGPTSQALAAGHVVLLEHIDEHPEQSRFHSREGGRTAVAAPCIGRSGLKGALHFGWRRELSITPAQLRLAEALASYAAVILENVRAHATLQDRAEAVRLANEQLTRLDEMKSNLISNVSHELRTPLSSIRAFSELLLDPEVANNTRLEFAHIINAESERLTRLVSNLLDLSRIQARGVTWQFQPVDLRKQLQLAVAALRPAAENKRLKLTLEMADDVPNVVADPDGLQQALVNLVSNAVKFTTTGQVQVKAASENGKVRVSVLDTGAGMTEDEQAHIFDRFYQAGDILTSKPAGTGLGLAITKEILVQHGTTICLESEPGKGSTFSFALPIA